MTAGQIATPYRPSRASFLAVALAVAFGIGLLVGLIAQRAAGPATQALTNAGAAAVAVGAGAPAVDTGARNFRGARDVRPATVEHSVGGTSVLEPKPYLTVQDGVVVPDSVTAAGAIDIGAANLRGGQDLQAPTGGRTSTSGSGWSRGAHPL